jgi:predicted dehydrogenase
MERIVDALGRGAQLVGICCEKPLARNAGEARKMVDLVKKAGVLHGYLENQVFAPQVETGRDLLWARGAATTGRPYLARAAEEHSGPHMPWFWRGDLQGGGVLLDMLCHSIEVGRHLLTPPGAPRDTLRPIKVSAQTASLKWSRPEYADLLKEMMGPEVDYRKAPSEDFARATIQYLDEKGQKVMTESTTSWSYVGAGLRLSLELLGPEYSMSANSLDAGGRVFFSRRLQGAAGEDLVEKQNAEQGLMPVVGSETAEYGYEGENRFFTQCFLDGKAPWLDFHAGLDVIRLLMACYMSAEQERVVDYPPKDLDAFVPAVARGTWKP